jgi:hypothetical protein
VNWQPKQLDLRCDGGESRSYRGRVAHSVVSMRGGNLMPLFASTIEAGKPTVFGGDVARGSPG